MAISNTGIPSLTELVTDFSQGSSRPIWGFGQKAKYSETALHIKKLYRPEVLRTICAAIDEDSSALQTLSANIHANPELAFEEFFAHDLLTQFMEEAGFSVTRHYLEMKTAWRAEFSHKNPRRTIGLNSEMDALPGMGHACGHNLIAIAGVAMAIGIKAALVQHDIPGRIILLGTPGEETTGGKIDLLKKGAYKEMDACLMVHPFSGPINCVGVGTTTAHQGIEVEYTGRRAHAGGGPWQGKNALDAAFLAYSGVSAFRQQMEPGTMSHGTIKGREWTPNVIPDYAKLSWRIRARTLKQLKGIRERIVKCFEGAGIQADCAMNMQFNFPWYEVRQNKVLALDFVSNAAYGLGMNVLTAHESTYTASTDFGNVTYELPGIHAVYSIPAEKNGGNHTPSFAKSAMTEEAFQATLSTAKALALSGFRIMSDPEFFNKVKASFEQERARLFPRKLSIKTELRSQVLL